MTDKVSIKITSSWKDSSDVNWPWRVGVTICEHDVILSASAGCAPKSNDIHNTLATTIFEDLGLELGDDFDFEKHDDLLIPEPGYRGSIGNSMFTREFPIRLKMKNQEIFTLFKLKYYGE